MFLRIRSSLECMNKTEEKNELRLFSAFFFYLVTKDSSSSLRLEEETGGNGINNIQS